MLNEWGCGVRGVGCRGGTDIEPSINNGLRDFSGHIMIIK